MDRPTHRCPAATLLPFLLIAMSLAGCLDGGPPTEPGGDLPGPELPAAAMTFFNEPVLVGPGGDAETSLFIADDGTVLACSHGGFRQPSPLWVSEDGGLTFRTLDPQPNPVPSGDCDVAVLADGTWAIVYDTIASATIATSPDRGASWDLNFVTALPAGGVDRPWILPDGNDIILTYADVMAVEPALNFFVRSTDHGRTWTEQTVVSRSEPPAKSHNIMGHIFADSEGTLRIPLTRSNLFTEGNPWYVDMAVSRDDGATWSVEPIVGPVASSFPLASADASEGRLYLSYAVDNGSAADILVITSEDEGASWSEPLTVATNVSFPGVRTAWLDARSDGQVTLAWLHEVSGEAPGWQAWTARVDPEADPAVRFLGPVTHPVNEDNLYEFIMVRHDAQDRAHVLNLVTGPNCADDPSADRSLQCVWLVSEAEAGKA